MLELSWRPKGLRVLREEPVQARGVPARAREEVWACWPALAPRGPPLQREQVEEQPGLRRIEAAAWLGLGSGLGLGLGSGSGLGCSPALLEDGGGGRVGHRVEADRAADGGRGDDRDLWAAVPRRARELECPLVTTPSKGLPAPAAAGVPSVGSPTSR